MKEFWHFLRVLTISTPKRNSCSPKACKADTDTHRRTHTTNLHAFGERMQPLWMCCHIFIFHTHTRARVTKCVFPMTLKTRRRRRCDLSPMKTRRWQHRLLIKLMAVGIDPSWEILTYKKPTSKSHRIVVSRDQWSLNPPLPATFCYIWQISGQISAMSAGVRFACVCCFSSKRTITFRIIFTIVPPARRLNSRGGASWRFAALGIIKTRAAERRMQ